MVSRIWCVSHEFLSPSWWLVGEEQGELREQHRRRGCFLFRLSMLMPNLGVTTEAGLDSGTISAATGPEACEPPFVLGEGGDASRRIRPSKRPRRTFVCWIKWWTWLMSSRPVLPARASVLVAEMWHPQTLGARLMPSSRTHPPSPAAAVPRRIPARHSVLGACTCRRRETVTIRRPRGPRAPDERSVVVDRVPPLEAAIRGFADRGTEVVVNPVLGTIFDSLAEAYEFYNLYSWVDKYKLHNNTFLIQIFEVRHKWAKPYFSGKLCAKQTSTQRSESANHLLKGYIPPACPMNLFVKQYSKLQFD